MPLSEILKLVVPAVCATLLSRLIVRRLSGTPVRDISALQVWTTCAAGACLGSFNGAVFLVGFRLLDFFPINYVVSTAFGAIVAVAVTQASIPVKAGDHGSRPEQ